MAYYGITSGMTYSEYLAFCFELNAISPKKLTDKQLILKISKEFSHETNRAKLSLKKLQHLRTLYNCGTLHRNYPVPLQPSFRYLRGVAVSRYGKPFNKSDIRIRLKYHQQRIKRYHAKKVKEQIEKPEPPKPKRKKPKVRKDSLKKRIRIGVRKATKEVAKRRWLQTQVARLQGLPPMEE